MWEPNNAGTEGWAHRPPVWGVGGPQLRRQGGRAASEVKIYACTSTPWTHPPPQVSLPLHRTGPARPIWKEGHRLGSSAPCFPPPHQPGQNQSCSAVPQEPLCFPGRHHSPTPRPSQNRAPPGSPPGLSHLNKDTDRALPVGRPSAHPFTPPSSATPHSPGSLYK